MIIYKKTVRKNGIDFEKSWAVTGVSLFISGVIVGLMGCMSLFGTIEAHNFVLGYVSVFLISFAVMYWSAIDAGRLETLERHQTRSKHSKKRRS